MFSTLSEYIFGTSTSSTTEPQGQVPEEPEVVDDWVVVKNEEESFLLSTELVTRNRVNIHEDLSRENFLIEHPLSLSSEEIQMRGIKIGRKKKRKGKRTCSGGCDSGGTKVRLSSRNYQALIPNLRNSHVQSGYNKTSRVLTLISKNNNNNNIKGQGQLNSGQDKRRENYHYNRHSGYNNDRKCGQRCYRP